MERDFALWLRTSVLAEYLLRFEKEGQHPTFALHVEATSAFEIQCIRFTSLATSSVDSFRYMDAARHSSGLHTTGGIHGISEHAVAGDFLANDATHDASKMYPNTYLHRFRSDAIAA